MDHRHSRSSRRVIWTRYVAASHGTSHRTSPSASRLCYLLNDLGSVFALVAHGTSQAGFDAEWRMINSLTVDGDLVRPLSRFSTKQTSTPHSRDSTSSVRLHRAWKTRRRVCTTATIRVLRLATGTQ